MSNGSVVCTRAVYEKSITTYRGVKAASCRRTRRIVPNRRVIRSRSHGIQRVLTYRNVIRAGGEGCAHSS